MNTNEVPRTPEGDVDLSELLNTIDLLAAEKAMIMEAWDSAKANPDTLKKNEEVVQQMLKRLLEVRADIAYLKGEADSAIGKTTEEPTH